MTSTAAPASSSPASSSSADSQKKAAIAAAITVVLWASAFVGIRMLADTYSPSALAFGRLVVATAALGAIALYRRRPLARGRTLLLVVGYGIAWFAGYNVALNQAEHHLDAGTAALLVNVAPILVAVLAGLILSEGFPRALVIGIAVAFCGVLLIALGGSPLNGADSDRLGIMLGLLTAALYATGVLLQKVALRRVDAVTATFMGCAAGTLVLAPFAPRFVTETADVPFSALAVVIYLGIFPTAIAFTTWAYALARTSAGRQTATTLSVPAVVILLSGLLLGELPTVLGMIGGALCLAGVALSRRRPAR